jgi:hypothetical protein
MAGMGLYRPDHTCISEKSRKNCISYVKAEILDRGKKLEVYEKYPTIQQIVLISSFMQTVEVLHFSPA